MRVSVTVLVLGVLLWFLYQYMVSSPLIGKDFKDEYDFIVSEYLKDFISIESRSNSPSMQLVLVPEEVRWQTS